MPFGAPSNASSPSPTSDAAASCLPPPWSTAGGAVEEEDDELQRWDGDEAVVRFNGSLDGQLQPSVARPVASRARRRSVAASPGDKPVLIASGDVVLGAVFS